MKKISKNQKYFFQYDNFCQIGMLDCKQRYKGGIKCEPQWNAESD